MSIEQLQGCLNPGSSGGLEPRMRVQLTSHTWELTHPATKDASWCSVRQLDLEKNTSKEAICSFLEMVTFLLEAII